MLPGEIISSSAFEKIVAKAQAGKGRSRLMGILFIRQSQAQAKTEVVPSLKYFDARSGEDMDFILPGWRFGKNGWVYSDESFNAALDVFEKAIPWKYESGIYLILFTARTSLKKTAGVGFEQSEEIVTADLSRVVSINLSKLKDNKEFNSIESFLEIVIRFAKTYGGEEPVDSFLRQEMRVAAVGGLKRMVRSFIPKWGNDSLEYIEEMSVKDFSKEKNAPMIQIVATLKEGKAIP